ncbi:hypothetical protein J1605_011639 [Eschrichtius robustus]|uniref:Uncharacterized protein n=1 Tax=Eschrichtius robustus TaxID=9764 RepID=A0AB34GPL1_ESCRO|nr:hypothetical protein J1605_011639 [Eschrichtius robustus]
MFRQGKEKLVILTNKRPALWKSETEYYTMLAQTGGHHYGGNNIELGTACGKYQSISTVLDSSIQHGSDSHVQRPCAQHCDLEPEQHACVCPVGTPPPPSCGEPYKAALPTACQGSGYYGGELTSLQSLVQ